MNYGSQAVHVLHLTRDFPPPGNGGISTAVGSLVAALESTGVTNSVVSFDEWRPGTRRKRPSPGPEAGDVDGVATLRIRAPRDRDASVGFIREKRPDVVHVHHGMLWELVPADLPSVVTIHVLQAAMNAFRGIEETKSLTAQTAAVDGATAVTAPTSWAADELRRLHPGIGNRLHVVALGTDHTGRFTPGGPIVATGRFADTKGTDVLFDAVIRILERLPDATAVLAGGLPANPRADRKWRERWSEVAPGSVRRRVELPGWLYRGDLDALLDSAGLYLSASHIETLGQSVLEAMAHGLPVVATDIGAHRELLGDAAVLVEPGDASRLADAAVELMSDAGAQRRLSRSALEIVESRYRWSELRERWATLYESLSS